MRLAGIIFFVFYSIGLRGQTQESRELDSLLTELKRIPDDTAKVFAYSRVSRLYILMRDHNDLALNYADSMSWLSENLHFEKGVVHAYYRHGEIEHFEGNYRQSIILQVFTLDARHLRPISITPQSGNYQILSNSCHI